MNKRGLGYMSIGLLLIILTVAVTVHENPNFNVEGFKSKLNWSPIDVPVEGQEELGNALESFINGVGAAYFYIAKWAVDFTIQYPDVPYKLLLYFLILTIIIPFAFYLIKIIALIFILTKEFLESKKDKLMLRRLEQRKRIIQIKKNDNFWNKHEDTNEETNN